MLVTALRCQKVRSPQHFDPASRKFAPLPPRQTPNYPSYRRVYVCVCILFSLAQSFFFAWKSRPQSPKYLSPSTYNHVRTYTPPPTTMEYLTTPIGLTKLFTFTTCVPVAMFMTFPRE